MVKFDSDDLISTPELKTPPAVRWGTRIHDAAQARLEKILPWTRRHKLKTIAILLPALAGAAVGLIAIEQGVGRLAEGLIDYSLGSNPLGTGADISGLGPSLPTSNPVPEIPHPAPTVGTEAVPPPPEIKPEPIDIEKPKFLPRAPEAPVVHHVSKETYDLASSNLSTIAGHAPIENPTDTQVSDFQSAMRGRGFDISSDDARHALEKGGFEARGATYEIWHSKNNPSSFITTEVDASHTLNGHAQHVDAAPITAGAPAEFSDADKAQYQKFAEGSGADTTFHPTPDHYQEATLSRDGTFGGVDGMRDTAHTLNGFTAEEIRTHEPPAGASPEVVSAWHKMQGWLNGEAAHIPYSANDVHISAYLLSIGMIG